MAVMAVISVCRIIKAKKEGGKVAKKIRTHAHCASSE